jgi:hypothetical protein
VLGGGASRPRSRGHSLLNTITIVKAKGGGAETRSPLGSRWPSLLPRSYTLTTLTNGSIRNIINTSWLIKLIKPLLL